MRRTLCQAVGCLLVLVAPAWSTAPTSYRDYEPLQGTGGRGSAFVTKCGDTYFAVSSIHQFDDTKPGIEDPSGKPLPLMPGPTRRMGDIQAWELSDQSGAVPFLRYETLFTLANGEAVAVRSFEGNIVVGKTTGLGSGGYNSAHGGTTMIGDHGTRESIKVDLETPLDAAGMSGAPVYKVSNGTVVGVLVSANSPTGARRISFLPLCLESPRDRGERQDRQEGKAPDTRIPIVMTLQGKAYTRVTVTESNSTKISILHDGGVATIAPSELDSKTRRLMKVSPSFEDAILEALAKNPSVVHGSFEYSVATLAAGIHWVAAPRMLMEAGGGMIEKFEPGSGQSAEAEAFKKLGAAFTQLQNMLRELGKTEVRLAKIRERSGPRNSRDDIKALIISYHELGEVMKKQKALIQTLTKQPESENFLFYIDDLEGTHLALETYLIAPRIEALKKAL